MSTMKKRSTGIGSPSSELDAHAASGLNAVLTPPPVVEPPPVVPLPEPTTRPPFPPLAPAPPPAPVELKSLCVEPHAVARARPRTSGTRLIGIGNLRGMKTLCRDELLPRARATLDSSTT